VIFVINIYIYIYIYIYNKKLTNVEQYIDHPNWSKTDNTTKKNHIDKHQHQKTKTNPSSNDPNQKLNGPSLANYTTSGHG